MPVILRLKSVVDISKVPVQLSSPMMAVPLSEGQTLYLLVAANLSKTPWLLIADGWANEQS